MNNLANSLLNQGHYQEAQKLHRETLTLRQRILGREHPDTLLSMNNLAVVLGRLKQFEEAGQLFRESVETSERTLGKDHPDTLSRRKNLVIFLVNASWWLAIGVDSTAEDHKLAVEYGREAVAINPNSPNCRDNFGVALYRTGQFAEAAETLEKARDMRNGKDPQHQFFLAMAYWQLGRQDDALREYQQASDWIEKKKRGDEYYRFRAEAETLFGDDIVAAMYADRIQEQPDSPGPLLARAAFYERQQRFDDAVDDYRQALDLLKTAGDSKADPWWGPQKKLAVELAEKPEIDRRLQQLRPDDPSLKIGRFRAHAAHNRWDQAQTLLEELIAAFPDNPHPWQLLAAVRYQRGDLTGYREACEQLLDRCPTQNYVPNLERTVRICLLSPDLMLDRLEQLRGMAETALAKSDEFPKRGRWFSLTRGLLAYRAGSYDKVPTWLEDARKHDDLHGGIAELLLAMTEYQTGQRQQARDDYHQAVARLERQTPPRGSLSRAFIIRDTLTAELLRREAEALLGSDSHPQPLVAPRPDTTEETAEVLVAEPAE
jgi:tetratricopeptide (TPR) repeat protein